jgi:hypothetical protein
MAVWEIFRRKPRPPQKVTAGRFEIERNGEVAYLEYTLAGNILELIHFSGEGSMERPKD